MNHPSERTRKLLESSLNTVDFTSPVQQNAMHQMATLLLQDDTEQIAGMARQAGAPLEFRISALLAESKAFVNTLREPLTIAVVFAMWGEQNRLKPKSELNPNGEDALRVKLDQLNWLFEHSPVKWTLYAVDDGCPNDSGKIAQSIARSHVCGDNVRVVWLEHSLPQLHGPLSGLHCADESRKGGAIICGCEQAIRDKADSVIYTDADNSVHLGQIGLLLKPYLQGKKIVLGNRKDPDSVLIKQESRWGIGITFLRHLQRMIGQAVFSTGIKDTQAAFKLYDTRVLQNILTTPTVYDFSFDTDWLLASIVAGQEFETAPFAFIDSAAESASITQGPMSTWYVLLKGLVEQVRAHDVAVDQDICAVLDKHVRSIADLESVINRLPPQLENVADDDLGKPELMSAIEIADWFVQCSVLDSKAA